MSTLSGTLISHRSPVQTERSQPEGQRIMPETRFTAFLAISVGPRVGISRLHRRPIFDYFFSSMTLKIIKYFSILTSFFNFIFDIVRRISTLYDCHSLFFVLAHVTSHLKFRILTSFCTSRVSCVIPWARKKFPVPLQIRQILSHR